MEDLKWKRNKMNIILSVNSLLLLVLFSDIRNLIQLLDCTYCNCMIITSNILLSRNSSKSR